MTNMFGDERRTTHFHAYTLKQPRWKIFLWSFEHLQRNWKRKAKGKGRQMIEKDYRQGIATNWTIQKVVEKCVIIQFFVV